MLYKNPLNKTCVVSVNFNGDFKVACTVVNNIYNKKAVLSQGSCAMPQLLFSVERQLPL